MLIWVQKYFKSFVVPDEYLFNRVEVLIMRDGLLVDFVVGYHPRDGGEVKYVYFQAKVDSSAFASLQRVAQFNQISGYVGAGIVVISTCVKVLYGSTEGRTLMEDDPWHMLPIKKGQRGTACSTFVHDRGEDVKPQAGDKMCMKHTPSSSEKKPHGLSSAFASPTNAILSIGKSVFEDPDSPYKTHSNLLFAEHTFAPDSHSHRKEFVAMETFINSVLGLSPSDCQVPSGQNTAVDLDIRASAFINAEFLHNLLFRIQKYDLGLFNRILQANADDWIRVQFKSLCWDERTQVWECADFGKEVGGKKKGRYDRSDFDISIFASFNFDGTETIDFRALWTAELVAHTPDVFDTTKEGAATVYFHTKEMKKNKSGNSWAWTLPLEKDAIKGLSIHFAPLGSEKDEYMVDLFKKSKLAGVTKEAQGDRGRCG